MLFVYPDTTTERIDFAEVLKPSEKLPKAYIRVLTEARQRMCDALQSQPSSQALVDAIEAYLPHLLRLIHVAETNRSTDSFKFKWRSVLSMGVRVSMSGKAVEKPVIRCASVYYEAIYTVLAYGFALSNLASKKCGSFPSAAAEAQLNEAIDLYCRVSGVFMAAATNWSPRWSGSPKDRPPETTTDSLLMLSELALLQAQLLATVKAEKRAMSPTTIIKLYRGAMSKFDSLAPKLKVSKRDYEEFSALFRAYVEDGGECFEGLLLKRFGTYSYEAGNNGLAVGCMTLAYNDFVMVQKTEYPAWKKIAQDNLAATEELRASYVKINNNVTYQPVPELAEIMAALPPMAMLVETKSFNLPAMAEVPEPTEEEMEFSGKKDRENDDDGGDDKDRDQDQERDSSKDSKSKDSKSKDNFFSKLRKFVD